MTAPLAADVLLPPGDELDAIPKDDEVEISEILLVSDDEVIWKLVYDRFCGSEERLSVKDIILDDEVIGMVTEDDVVCGDEIEVADCSVALIGAKYIMQ